MDNNTSLKKLDTNNYEQLSLFDDENNIEYTYNVLDDLNNEITITGIKIDYCNFFDYAFIAQSNHFINLCQYYKSGNALQIINFIKTLIKPTDCELKNYVITRKQIQAILRKKDTNHLNRTIENLKYELISSFFTSPDGKTVYPYFMRVTTTEEYNIEVTLNPLLQNYFIKLIEQGNYTQFKLQNLYLIQLNKPFALRLYELLISNINSKQKHESFYTNKDVFSVSYNIEKIKKLLGFSLEYVHCNQKMETPKWTDNTHFFNRIIKPSIDIINENTNIYVDVYKIKEKNSKKYSKYQFDFYVKEDDALTKLTMKAQLLLFEILKDDMIY